MSDFYKEFTNFELTEQDFFIFDGFEEKAAGLATEKYQTHLKFIHSTTTPIRPETSLTFCRCLSLQNQKALDRNLRIIFSVTCRKTTQKFLTQEKNITKEKLQILCTMLMTQDNLNF